MAAAGYIWAQDAQEQLTPAAQNHIASHRHWLDECEHPHPKIGFCTKLCGFKIDDVDEEEEEDLTFVKLLPRTGKQRREVQKLVEEDMALSEEAAFEKHVVRYRRCFADFDLLVVERLPSPGIRPWDDTLRDSVILDIAWDALKALAYLHGRGVVHGDIHPGNIIHFPNIARDDDGNGTYKLFGHGLVPKVARNDEALGRLYTAPELRNRAYKPTFKSDVWMLGMALLECHELGVGAWGVPRQGDMEMFVKQLAGRSHGGRLEYRREGCGSGGEYFHEALELILGVMLVEKPRERASAMEALRKLGEKRHKETDTSEDAGQLIMPVKTAARAARKEIRDRSPAGKAFVLVKGIWDWLLLLGIALLFALK